MRASCDNVAAMGILDKIFGRTPAATAPTTRVAGSPASPLGPRRTVKLVRGNGPATSRELVARTSGVTLAKFDNVGVSLAKRGLTGVRAEAVLLLDHSVSMSHDYENGNVQALVDHSLAFALQVDADGKIPVIRFDTRPRPAIEVTSQNVSRIMNKLYEPGKMGSTDLTGALEELLKIAKTTESPIFAIVITDGAPNDQRTATKVVQELAQYPVFLKFIAIQRVRYLEDLDEMGGRLVDNANAQFIPTPISISDAQFAEKMVVEWDTWIGAAADAGILS